MTLVANIVISGFPLIGASFKVGGVS